MRHIKALAIGILLMAAAITVPIFVAILVPVLLTVTCIGLAYFVVAICRSEHEDDDDDKPP